MEDENRDGPRPSYPTARIDDQQQRNLRRNPPAEDAEIPVGYIGPRNS